MGDQRYRRISRLVFFRPAPPLIHEIVDAAGGHRGWSDAGVPNAVLTHRTQSSLHTGHCR